MAEQAHDFLPKHIAARRIGRMVDGEQAGHQVVAKTATNELTRWRRLIYTDGDMAGCHVKGICKQFRQVAGKETDECFRQVSTDDEVAMNHRRAVRLPGKRRGRGASALRKPCRCAFCKVIHEYPTDGGHPGNRLPMTHGGSAECLGVVAVEIECFRIYALHRMLLSDGRLLPTRAD